MIKLAQWEARLAERGGGGVTLILYNQKVGLEKYYSQLQLWRWVGLKIIILDFWG